LPRCGVGRPASVILRCRHLCHQASPRRRLIEIVFESRNEAATN
jgi:hypothetical protein